MRITYFPFSIVIVGSDVTHQTTDPGAGRWVSGLWGSALPLLFTQSGLVLTTAADLEFASE